MRRIHVYILIVCGAAGCGSAQRHDTATPRETYSDAEIEDDEIESETAASSENALERTYAEREAIRVLRGRASYYHDSLAGNTTANGEVYEPAAYTAASRKLAFGTIVRVVRVDSGRSVIVRINDRGPFGDRRRILDLSRAAAERIGMIRAGVVDIRAEILAVPAD